jgi:hypothetical protein
LIVFIIVRVGYKRITAICESERLPLHSLQVWLHKTDTIDYGSYAQNMYPHIPFKDASCLP